MIRTAPTLVIGGSFRAQRICIEVARWVAAEGRKVTGDAYEVVDLKAWPLPLDDEPGIPAAGGYTQDHTRAWSEKIKSAGALIFVTPQYNWGYPAALKNALDHLFAEWAGKPAMIVTYGGHGGGKCAEQLQQVVEALHMKLAPTKPALNLPREMIEANAGQIDPAVQFASHLPTLRQALGELAAV